MTIKEHLPLKAGMLAYLVGGNHVGETGIITSIKENVVEIKTEKETFETAKKVLIYDLKSGTISVESTRDFGEEAENIDVADKTNYVAFTAKNNV